VMVYPYSLVMPSRRGQEQFLLDGPYLFLRTGVSRVAWSRALRKSGILEAVSFTS
jgi:hypothetical protein